MHRDDPLTQIRLRARLHGRKHALRVVRAVLHPLRGLVGEAAFQSLIRQLPPDLGHVATDRRPGDEIGSRPQFIRAVAEELHIHDPDAAFYARVTFEQLNAFCRGVTPARLASSLPADLGPLLSASADGAADRHRRRIHLLGSAIATLDLSAPAPARAEAEPAAAMAPGLPAAGGPGRRSPAARS